MINKIYIFTLLIVFVQSCATSGRRLIKMKEQDPDGVIELNSLENPDFDERFFCQEVNVRFGSVPMLNFGVTSQNNFGKFGSLNGFLTTGLVFNKKNNNSGIENFETQINFIKTFFAAKQSKLSIMPIYQMPAYTILEIDFIRKWNLFVGYNHLLGSVDIDGFYIDNFESTGATGTLTNITPGRRGYWQNIHSLSTGILYQRYFNSRFEGNDNGKRLSGSVARSVSYTLQADIAVANNYLGGSFGYQYKIDWGEWIDGYFDPEVEFNRNFLGFVYGMEVTQFNGLSAGPGVSVFLYTGIKPGYYYYFKNLFYLRCGIRLGIAWTKRK